MKTNRSWNTPLILAAIVLLASSLSTLAASGKKWRTYVDCEYRPSSGNNGDSFHVDCMKLLNGREVKEIKTEKARHKLLRLYYVAAPTAMTRPAAAAPAAAGNARVVTLTRPTYIYPLDPKPLGQLRAGATLQVIKILDSAHAQVRITTPAGRSIDGIAKLSDLGIKP